MRPHQGLLQGCGITRSYQRTEAALSDRPSGVRRSVVCYGQVMTPSVAPPPPTVTLQDLVPAEMLVFSTSTDQVGAEPELDLNVLPVLSTKLYGAA